MAVGPGQSGEKTGIFAISIFGGAPRELRDDAGRASISPDGSHIAFLGPKSESEIWLMGGGGEEPHKILDAGEGARFLQLQWSPDGQRIAFLQSQSQAAAPEVMIGTSNLSGQETTVVLSDPKLRSFCWAPDGRVVFAQQEPPPNDTDTNLWTVVVNPATGKAQGQPQRITAGAGFSFWDLSMTADGKRLVFVKSEFQYDVFVGELTQDGTRLASPRRVTLNARDDLPSAWTPDGRSIFFYSNRNGNWDIFKQGPEQRTAEEFVLGPEEETEPRLSPDGASVLYWAHLKTEKPGGGLRLLRVPVAGGPPQQILEESWGAHFRCAKSPANLCVLSEENKERKQLTFTAFDPARGRTGELASLQYDPASAPVWDLSPDGSKLAIANLGEDKNHIRILQPGTGALRDVALKGEAIRVSDLAWSANGTALLVIASSLRGSKLLHVKLNGDAQQLWEVTTSLASPVPSPDGKRVAFAISTQNSNVWMIENF